MPNGHYANPQQSRTVIIHSSILSVWTREIKRTCVCMYLCDMQWLLYDGDGWRMAYDYLLRERGRNARPWMRDEKYDSLYVWVGVSCEWECTLSETLHTKLSDFGLKIAVKQFTQFEWIWFTEIFTQTSTLLVCGAGDDRSIRPNNNRNGKCSSFVWCSALFVPLTDRQRKRRSRSISTASPTDICCNCNNH